MERLVLYCPVLGNIDSQTQSAHCDVSSTLTYITSFNSFDFLTAFLNLYTPVSREMLILKAPLHLSAFSYLNRLSYTVNLITPPGGRFIRFTSRVKGIISWLVNTSPEPCSRHTAQM